LISGRGRLGALASGGDFFREPSSSGPMGYHIPFIPFPYEVWDFLMGIFGTVNGSGILHQLRLVVYPIIYRVLATSQVVVWDFFHQRLYRYIT